MPARTWTSTTLIWSLRRCGGLSSPFLACPTKLPTYLPRKARRDDLRNISLERRSGGRYVHWIFSCRKQFVELRSREDLSIGRRLEFEPTPALMFCILGFSIDSLRQNLPA